MGHSLTTKKAMAYSLKALMTEMPFNKITIDKIVANCGYNRQTFYYHFKDIKELFEWLYIFETQQLVGDVRKLSTSNAIAGIMRYLYENREVTLCAFSSLGREYVEKFIYSCIYDAIHDHVIQKSVYVIIDGIDIEFIANYFTLTYVALLVQWMDKGMEEEIEPFISRLGRMMQGSVDLAVQRMKKD
ncbi:MAG: TetR/AcrR family transcriptional regulator C-terminal domain-containing protein [Clostridia bacterium]